MIGGIATSDLEGIKARFADRAPVKAVSIFLGVLALSFCLLWLSEIVPALIAGEVPKSVTECELPTNAVHVLDMAWMLPAMGLTTAWLWRKRAFGYALAGALLTFIMVEGLALVSMTVFMRRYDQPATVGQTVIFGALSVVSLGMLTWFLRGLRER